MTNIDSLLRLADGIASHGPNITYPSRVAAQEVRRVVQELADALRPELASRAELALAAEELAKLPGDVYWIFAKGRTRPDEPLWGIQITDKTGIVLALVEGEHPVDTVRHAASLLTRD